jgi:hypothetical protein
VFLTGLGVFAALTLMTFLPTLAWIITDASYSYDPIGYLGEIMGELLPPTLITDLTFSLWLVLSFAVITPISAGLRMSQVVCRSLLTALVGSFVAGVTTMLLTAFLYLNGPIGMWALEEPLSIFRTLVRDTSDILWVSLVLAPLAGLLLWGWLRRPAPISTTASVPTQEVSA